jgi:hypothetical protein
VSSDEQQGFIYGYLDCRQTLHATKASVVDYQNAVTGIIKSERTKTPNAVDEAIEHARTTLKSRDLKVARTMLGLTAS